MKIRKFGGTSVAAPENINKIIEIVVGDDNGRGQTIVVSAFGGVTDELIKMVNIAADGNEDWKQKFLKLEVRHSEAVRALISINKQGNVLAKVRVLFNELESITRGAYLVREVSARTQDLVMSFGERLSAFIISEAFKEREIDAEFLDARELIKTDNNFGNAQVDSEITYQNIKKYFAERDALQVITGFVASSCDGITTTLGRGGSDYTASIFGAALDASVIEIWTDVDGVMTADPRKVKNAFILSEMTYKEAMEMSHFGAKVIYPPTVRPAMVKKIPLHIKNTFNPSASGTIINQQGSSNGFVIKGISSISHISLLRIEGSGMVGVMGTAMRVFGALAKNSINVILITQASSEHSICIAINPDQAETAKQVIEREFALEIETNRVDPVIIEKDLSVVAIVGENMRQKPGIAGRIFNALGRHNINVVAIAQGSSELNISVVVSNYDEARALQAIHDIFFFPNQITLNLFLVGTGLIGSTLLEQIQTQAKAFTKRDLDIRVVGMANTERMLFREEGIVFEKWAEELAKNGEVAVQRNFLDMMKRLNLPNSIFIDCTASQEIVSLYQEILQSGISIITPNKKANSGKLEFYRDLRKFVSSHGPYFLYETNVGAGLPIINTLSDLISTGDKIIKIEAVLSGTLSFIFNNFSSGDKKFSDIVREARDKGYTEPDPRDDLSGLDVARKVLILAREVGFDLELENVGVISLISDSCKDAASIEDFFTELEKMNEDFERKKIEAVRQGRVLRYIASLEDGKARISLDAIDQSHPFYGLSGSDNIISFTTERYKERPLVVRGPGAGARVTAAGVLADILRISNYNHLF